MHVLNINILNKIFKYELIINTNVFNMQILEKNKPNLC